MAVLSLVGLEARENFGEQLFLQVAIAGARCCGQRDEILVGIGVDRLHELPQRRALDLLRLLERNLGLHIELVRQLPLQGGD